MKEILCSNEETIYLLDKAIRSDFSNKVKASDFMKFIKVEVKTTEVHECGDVLINGEDIWDVPAWNYMRG